MSQASTIFRANANSGFYTAVKSRKSASSQASCKLLYSQEVNYCPSCRTKVETFASSGAAYGSKIVFELPNFGHLSECFLKVKWNAGAAAAEATNRNCLIENAIIHLCQTIKLIVDGVEVARCTPESLLCSFYKHSSQEQKKAFQELTGGYKNRSALTAFSASANVKSVLFPEARSANADGQVQYLPLQFWFSALNEQMNRAVPLGVLDRCFIEIETNDASYINITAGTSTDIALNKMSIVSFLTELDGSEEAMYRNSSFQAGAEPLSVLGKTFLQHVETGIAHTTGTATAGTIKLNMFSGQISKLYIVCISAEHDSNDIWDGSGSGTAVNTDKNHFKPVEMKQITLQANGVEIYKMEELDQNENKLEDWINRDFDTSYTSTTTDVEVGGSWSQVSTTGTDRPVVAGEVTVAPGGSSYTASEHNEATQLAAFNAMRLINKTGAVYETSSINPDHIYCLNFKNVGADQRDSSMTGSINFSNLSVPSLKYTISKNAPTPGTYNTSSDFFKYKIVVIGVQHNLVSYSTNNAGRVALRSVS